MINQPLPLGNNMLLVKWKWKNGYGSEIPLVHSMIANDSSVVAMRRQVDVDQRQMDDIDGGGNTVYLYW